MVVTIRFSTLLTITALHAMAFGAGRLYSYVVVTTITLRLLSLLVPVSCTICEVVWHLSQGYICVAYFSGPFTLYVSGSCCCCGRCC